MTASLTRVAGSVLALLLSGTPTALLACAAWCLPGMSHDGAPTVALTASAPELVPEAAALAPSAHAHHHLATPEPPAHPVPFAGGGSLSAPAAGADGHGCCPDTLTLVGTAATVRADERSMTATIATGPAPFRRARVTGAMVRWAGSAARPRLQTPLVLRI